MISALNIASSLFLKCNTIVFFLLFFGLSACNSNKNIKLSPKKNVEINQDSPSDTILVSMVQPYKTALDEKMLEVLNYSEVDLLKGRPEGNLGNFVADLCYEISSEIYTSEDGKSIDFCLLNEGSLRVAIPKGPITLGKVYEVMPFRNELVVITLSYNKTIELFEYLIQSGGEPISHAQLTIKDEAIASASINGLPLDSTRTYKVLTSDYLARGGDKMYFFSDPVKSESVGLLLRDAIIEYLIYESEEGRTITAKTEGRISYE